MRRKNDLEGTVLFSTAPLCVLNVSFKYIRLIYACSSRYRKIKYDIYSAVLPVMILTFLTDH